MQTNYGSGRKKTARKEKKSGRQLVQLLLCLAVFLVVFIGKGVFPSKVAQTGEQLLRVIRTNTDFRAAFANLGQALSQQESVLGEIGDFCVSVFAPVQQEAYESNSEPSPTEGQEQMDSVLREQLAAGIDEETEIQTEQILQVGDVVQVVQETGTSLPEGYSDQWLFLGDMKTVTPVMGTVTSHFGYRDHPTIGRYAVHAGVDIAADKGTDVAAFADGVVEGSGQNEDFGRYLQINHSNGVSTFYSHCDRVLVQKGEKVEVGQTVAQVGTTGQSTGPHLHFEISLEGVRLNPMHYIAPEQGQ